MALSAKIRCGILLVGLSALLAGEAAADAAKKNYRLFCMGCHQADGSGSPENGIPSMRDEVGHFLRVPEGRAYLSQVPGTLNTPLGDAETADVLNWIMVNIGRASIPSDFKSYTAEDVKAYRATVPQDIPGMRVRLLKQLESIQLGSVR
jgi:mono/diheme cytochrome c family protein